MVKNDAILCKTDAIMMDSDAIHRKSDAIIFSNKKNRMEKIIFIKKDPFFIKIKGFLQ